MKSIGSEWNQWDLHFHTPSSYDYQDKSVTSKDIIQKMKSDGISTFAVTDHHLIDVNRINELKAEGEKSGIHVLPGIEFLSDARGNEPIHFIAIFSENCNLDHLWGVIKFGTSIKDVEGQGKKPNEVYCDLIDTCKLIKENDGIITIHAGQKHGTIETITNSLPQTMAQKRDIADVVDIYELGKESDQAGYKKHVFPSIGRIIPMIMCSDNHDIKKYDRKAKLWIKGTPNFEGLKYALNEPENRFYIGDEPDVIGRVKANKTKYIEKIHIASTGTTDNLNKWFVNVDIPLNPELVSIIGNKGSGKSALADVIGICCDAEHQKEFQFLHKDKFLKKGLAGKFEATVQFSSKVETPKRTLNHDIVSSSVPKVRYLPQSYFEKVCNEIGSAAEFKKEIENVVFQYVPTADRLNQPTFQNLIAKKAESIESELSLLNVEMNEANKRIVELENRSSPQYLAQLSAKLQSKLEEFSQLENSPPALVVEPLAPIDGGESSEGSELDRWTKQLAAVQDSIEVLQRELRDSKLKQSDLSLVKRDLEAIATNANSSIKSRGAILSKYGITVSELIEVKFDWAKIDAAIAQVDFVISEIELKLMVSAPDPTAKYEELNLAQMATYCREQLGTISQKISAEQKEYQNYLLAKSQWEKSLIAIQGAPENPDTVKWFENELAIVKTSLVGDLEEARISRLAITN